MVEHICFVSPKGLCTFVFHIFLQYLCSSNYPLCSSNHTFSKCCHIMQTSHSAFESNCCWYIQLYPFWEQLYGPSQLLLLDMLFYRTKITRLDIIHSWYIWVHFVLLFVRYVCVPITIDFMLKIVWVLGASLHLVFYARLCPHLPQKFENYDTIVVSTIGYTTQKQSTAWL